MTPRAAAIHALDRWLRTGAFPSRALAPSSPFALEIVQGVLRNKSALEFAIAPFCRKSPPHAAMAALLAGAWQLLFGDIPAYAALNETVSAARSLRIATPGFVNAVLRNVLNGKDAILAKLDAAPLHIRTSFPQPLVERWTELYGADVAEDLCEAGRGIPPVTAYPIENGVVGQPFTVPHGTAVQALPGFADGAFIVQDAAAAATVSDFLAPRPGETILDCCAAPGGKTIQAALAVGPAGHVVALDNSEARLARLRDNLSRVHLSGRVETALCDATSPELAAMLHGRRFDAALIDAPCSNSGVMARKPDARWRWSMDETRRVAQVQRGILRNVATLDVGRIVYSTCSIDRAENEDVAIAFACECGWKISSGRTLLPGGGARYRFGRDGKFLPSAWHDGAFAALLVRAI